MQRTVLPDPAILRLSHADLGAAGWYGTKMSLYGHHVALAQAQHHIVNPTNLSGALDDGIEDRLDVGRRAADDAEHFGRRRLVLQRLAQFCVAVLDLLKQPHVLDGNYGLRREG